MISQGEADSAQHGVDGYRAPAVSPTPSRARPRVFGQAKCGHGRPVRPPDWYPSGSGPRLGRRHPAVSGFGKALMVASVLLVLIVELLNSGLEAVTDRISLEDHVLAKRAKDLGSAAVMLSSSP